MVVQDVPQMHKTVQAVGMLAVQLCPKWRVEMLHPVLLAGQMLGLLSSMVLPRYLPLRCSDSSCPSAAYLLEIYYLQADSVFSVLCKSYSEADRAGTLTKS